MTLDELIEEVYIITARRDLIAETKSAVKKSTLKAHKSDFYSKDIYEEGIQFPSSDFLQSFDPHAQWSSFRSWKYFKRVRDGYSFTSQEQQTTPIEIISVEETLDSYGCNRSDIAYVAGRMLEIRSSVAFTKALVGCYLLPTVTDSGYASWVAEQYPFFIIHEAARLVFAAIGKMEESNMQARFAAEEFMELRSGALADVGS